jgi:glycosyltransferase involved in cell wall biosynthesis
VQILHTCRALAAAGAPVHLLLKRNRRLPVAGVAEGLARYGIEPHPLWRIEFLPMAHAGLAGLVARRRVRRARGARFYARHERLALAAARGGGGPVVLELHNIGPGTPRALAAAAGVVAITSPLAERVRALARRELPIEVIPDGFDPSLFTPVATGGEPRAVYAGQLLDWKGVDVLVRAIARTGEPPLRLLVVGGRSGRDPEAERLRALARELGVSERIEWTGPLPHREVRGRLRPGDIGVVPTRAQRGQEIAASPLKLVETMACGLPVVGSDLPAIHDVVRDGENGLLFAEGDAGALAAALRRLRDDPGLRARLGERALRDVQRYAWPERARRILAFFERIERGAAAARGVSAAS